MSSHSVEGPSPFSGLLDWYLSVFNHKYQSLWFVEQYPHAIPAVTLTLYLSMLYFLPKILMSFQATRKGINLGFVLPLWNLFLSVWSAAMAIGVLFPYGVREKPQQKLTRVGTFD